MRTRKYQHLWESLKQDCSALVTLDVIKEQTVAQRHRQLRTIRKAVSKEKYKDINYRIKNPNSEITSTIDAKKGTIIFELDHDVTDVQHLF